jgi:hypothetical protein
MRTTVDLPDELYRALKIRAASSGVTLRHLVERLVEQGLRQPSGAAGRPGEPPPVIIPPRGVPIAAVPRAELARLEEEEDQAKHARSARR